MVAATTARKFRWQFAWIFLALVAVIATAGYLYFNAQERQFLQSMHERLSAIADLKARQLVSWRQAQLDDADFIRSSPFLWAPLRAYLTAPADGDAQAELLVWMHGLQKRYQYKRILLLDAQARPCLSMPQDRLQLDEGDRVLAQQALRKNQVLFSDLHAENPANRDIHMDLYVPLAASRELRQVSHSAALASGPHVVASPLALVLLQVDPREFLYPLLDSWPTITQSRTSETLLVRREGDEVVFLNELRHHSAAALRFRQPLASSRTPAARVLQGFEGVLEGPDYRGVPVVAATRKVAGSPWCLVAKIDQAEVYQDLRAGARQITFVVGLCIATAGLCLSLLWSRREAEFVLRERQEKLGALSQMAAGVAHEVRNPLTAIKARLFMLGKGLAPGSPERQDAQVIGKEIDRIERIVKEYLSFARPADPRLAPVEAAKLLGEVQELLAPQLAQAQVQLQVEPGPPAQFPADGEQLKQVLINLVQNAAEAIGRNGAITLRARQGNGVVNGSSQAVVILEVEDSGPGIAPEVQGRLFEPFFSTKTGGSGLGLSIAQGIVERHHGRLEYQTEWHHGTTFKILLPAA